MAPTPDFVWTDIFRRKKSDKNASIIEALRENLLFCTLSSQELQYLSSVVYERVYEPDEVVFRQNDAGFGMYMIAKGSIAIKTRNPAGEGLVTTLGKGSFFGEISLVEENNVRSASAVALERSVLIGFFKPDLLEILERKPPMGVKILFQLSTVLAKRLLQTNERLAQSHEEAA